jgi:hypothetical protein
MVDTDVLIAALADQHDIIDSLLAELITAKPGWFPTQSPLWLRIVSAHEILVEAQREQKG